MTDDIRQCSECGCDLDEDDIHLDRFDSGEEYCSQDCADATFFAIEHRRLESHQSRYL